MQDAWMQVDVFLLPLELVSVAVHRIAVCCRLAALY